MPVYWFALIFVPEINWGQAILIFSILHILVYPASNGYNSFMDKDVSPIGGLKNPMQPTGQLLHVTILMNLVALALSLFVSLLFTIGIFFYILASMAYSYRKIRLKKYPILGYATVIIFQGALCYFLVYHGSSALHTVAVPLVGMLAATLLIGGFYPLTQIYQHEADCKDGVTTISYLLGYRGTFIFTGIVYVFAFITLGWLFYIKEEIGLFIILQLFMLPVAIYFLKWFRKVATDIKEANFKNTMQMNMLASFCTNLGFIILLIVKNSE